MVLDFQEIRDAVVVPPDTSRMRQKTGVLTADGTVVEQAGTWRNDTLMTIAPDQPDNVSAELSGTWLWGGSLYDHFGHFLVESQSRVWASHALSSPIDGILFVPKLPRRGPELAKFQQDVFASWQIDKEVVLALRPTKVERLIVLEQALGLGRRISGTREMRDVSHQYFGANIPADGPKDIYVSRSQLPAGGGTVLAESTIEAALAAEGYEIFHPQNYDISTQIARYKAAERLIFCDGSAIHLFAYIGRAHQQVAVLPRRNVWTDGPVDHLRAFSGIEPLILPGVCKEWYHRGQRGHRTTTFVLHDLNKVGAALMEAQFTNAPIAPISPDQLEQLIARCAPPDQYALVDDPA